MTATVDASPQKGYDLIKRLVQQKGDLAAAQVGAIVKSKHGITLDEYHALTTTPDAEKFQFYREIVAALMKRPNPAPAPAPVTGNATANCDQLFQELAKELRAAGADAMKKVAAHIRTVSGHNLLPVFHKNASEDQKLQVYTLCLQAVRSRDFSKLQGKVGAGDKRPDPVEEVESTTPAEELIAGTRSRVPAEPQVEVGDDEDAVLKVLAERLKKPKFDEAAVRKLVDEAIGKAMGAVDTALDAAVKRIPGDEDIRKVIEHAMGNGSFPEKRVMSLIEDRLKKVAPTWDVDTIVKPRIDALLSSTVQDFLKRGPAALTAAPKLVDNGTLASSIPAVDPTFVVTKAQRDFLKHIEARSKVAPINVMAVGPHGCGKTTLAAVLASEFTKPLLVMDCANIREPRDWFGYKYTDAGTVLWHRSQFDRCLEAGNHVIVLDELPRTTDQIRNTLFPLLDYRRQTYLEERGGYITVGPGTIFFVTANIGMGYTGCSELDLALDDRLTRRIEVNYLPVDKEAGVLVQRTGIDHANATKLAELAQALRLKAVGFGATLTKTISTRQLIEAAEDFKALGTAGLTYSIVNHFSPDGGDQSERSQVLIAVQGKFGTV